MVCFSSRRRHTRYWRDWSSRRVLFRSIILSLGGVIGFQLAGLATDLPRYQSTIRDKVGSLREGSSIGRLPELLKDFGRQFDRAVGETPPPAPDASSEIGRAHV